MIGHCDPNSANVIEPQHPALAFACPDCNAKPGARCAGLIRACKYLDVPHAKRRALVKEET